DSGFVARYGEINDIPATLVEGAKVGEGEQLGIVQRHTLHSRAASMLHLELYKGDRSGTLSIPHALEPKLAKPVGKRKRKHPSEFTAEERAHILSRGYLPDFLRRADLVDPTEFLKRLEAGATGPSGTAMGAAIVMALIAGNPLAALGLAGGLLTGGGPGVGPSAGGGGGDPRAYTGPLSAHPSDQPPPPGLGPRDYWGPMDVAWDEEE
ncbi:MAG TPA: hypothetical protein VD970_16145, partial [Acetobacteraceae bacterium]|nr:hypothetical protein [Acetobacteraceae bacterium]